MKEKVSTVRVNSRILTHQKEFIKKESKRMKIGEGELHRIIIETYINNKK